MSGNSGKYRKYRKNLRRDRHEASSYRAAWILTFREGTKESRNGYWKDLDVTTYVDWEDFLERNPGAKIYYATTKGRHVYSDAHFEPTAILCLARKAQAFRRRY